jgi:hypothetical protein
MGFFTGLLSLSFGKDAKPGEMTKQGTARKEKVGKRKSQNAAALSKGKFRWRWDNHKVLANSKSEARSILKKKLGLKRLPIGANITRF